jgi:hypothetical protein
VTLLGLPRKLRLCIPQWIASQRWSINARLVDDVERVSDEGRVESQIDRVGRQAAVFISAAQRQTLNDAPPRRVKARVSVSVGENRDTRSGRAPELWSLHFNSGAALTEAGVYLFPRAARDEMPAVAGA